jgi:hypothetical protein
MLDNLYVYGTRVCVCVLESWSIYVLGDQGAGDGEIDHVSIL